MCVRANFMLDRDARRLMEIEVKQLQDRSDCDPEAEEASIEKKIQEMTDRTLTGALIHAVQRQAEVTEHKQRLFGVTVTLTLLQGWMISLGLVFLQALWAVCGKKLVNLDPADLAAKLICWQKAHLQHDACLSS